jgi:hypothetical protein
MGRVNDAIAAYQEAVRLHPGFEEATDNLVEAQKERQKPTPGWIRILALGVPFVVLSLAIGVITALEERRGPDWLLELEDYVATRSAGQETAVIRSVATAKKPQNFKQEMGQAVASDWAWESAPPSFPAVTVQCVLLEWSRKPHNGRHDEIVHEIVFLAYHSDALHHVGWLAYLGAREPFSGELFSHLQSIECDLDL